MPDYGNDHSTVPRDVEGGQNDNNSILKDNAESCQPDFSSGISSLL